MFKKAEQKPVPSWEFATSLDKACDVLCCFTSMKPSWGISELARQLGLPKSGIFASPELLKRKAFYGAPQARPISNSATVCMN